MLSAIKKTDVRNDIIFKYGLYDVIIDLHVIALYRHLLIRADIK